MAQENASLVAEQAIHGDLLLLDNHVDTYRNLPRKLLGFYTWAAEQPVSFTLKTDDDCFVNLNRCGACYVFLAAFFLRPGTSVLEGLDRLQGHPHVWWSHFRLNWVVERTGKWAELDYAPMVYPPFGTWKIVAWR